MTLGAPSRSGGTGSSPRGRGTRRRRRAGDDADRFIPARAGNMRGRIASISPSAVHPRAGGEHVGALLRLRRIAGSSPRGRGTRQGDGARVALLRFIPARAGNTAAVRLYILSLSVHPRAGGEHQVQEYRKAAANGSSPRGRGTRGARRGARPRHRFIPARAGNTVAYVSSGDGPSVHPRAGGEHANRNSFHFPFHGSSPRGRGTPSRPAEPGPQVRFIPARAGNTSGAG